MAQVGKNGSTAFLRWRYRECFHQENGGLLRNGAAFSPCPLSKKTMDSYWEISDLQSRHVLIVCNLHALCMQLSVAADVRQPG